MTNWKDAIAELTRLGCSIRISEDNIHVKWEGKGNPPPKERFDSLIGVITGHKIEILGHLLIDETLKEINEAFYQPGLLNYLKFSKPIIWERLLQLETIINEGVFDNDLNKLNQALDEYKHLIREAGRQFGTSDRERELPFQQNVCRQ
jgi:hypothetical protein